ncbi:gasdermin-E-like [Diadema antillarum]|uniref:gasdermin-E-like n=1 Tax=Diadema antillarum TaxID=105358 RepID=UPI003A8537C6
MSSVDYSNLVPVTGLVDAKYCRPCHLVVKRNKKHFWNRVKILPTPFKLSDVLRDEDADMKWDSFRLPPSDIVAVDRSLTFEAKGKLESSLPHELVDVEVEGGTAVAISVALGDIVENSLDIPSLVHAVNCRKINPSHDFIRETMSNSRNSLCLVVTSLNNKSKIEIKAEYKAEGGANVDVDVTPGDSTTVDVGGKLLTERKRCLQIPADTAIAFRMHELLVKADQTMQLLLLPDSEGGFRKMNRKSVERKDETIPEPTESPPRGCKESPGETYMTEIREGMQPIFHSPDDGLSIIRKSLFELMTTPLALDKLNDLLHSAVHRLLIGEKSSKISDDALDDVLGGVGLNATKNLLKVAGFAFSEAEVTYPDSDRDGVLTCLADLLDVMAALSEDQCRKLLQCTETERSALMEMLEESLSVDRLPLNQTRVTSLTEEFPHVESLMFSVGFELERKRGEWFLCQGSQKGDECVTPGEILAVIFALWGQ